MNPPRLYDGRSLDDWRQAMQLLDYKSPDRAAAVPGLRQIIRDPDAPWFTRRQAALTLGRIGELARAAVDDLIQLLDVPLDPVETSPPLWALKALALFGPLAVDAAPRAILILRDDRQPVILRMTATETLGRIGVASADGIAALIAGGTSQAGQEPEQLELRIACIEALQLAKPPAAVPMLVAACDDPSDRIRHAAAATLGVLGSHAEPAAEVLGVLVIHDEIPVVREAAARSLAQVGPRGAEVLMQLLAHGDRDVQLLAIDGARRATARQSQLASVLVPLFNHESPLVRAQAMDAYWRLTRQADPVLNRLVSLLEHEDRRVRKSASDTLLLLGSEARPALPQLERLATEGDPLTQAAARRVLRSLQPMP